MRAARPHHHHQHLVGDCAVVIPAPTLPADDQRTLVYAIVRVDVQRTLVYAIVHGEHQGEHAELLDAVDSALRGSNNTTISIAVGSDGNRTVRLCALACQGVSRRRL